MKKVFLLALAAVLTVGMAAPAVAQKFELGARAGIGSQNMDVKGLGLFQNEKVQLGWHLAAVSRIRLIGFGDGLLGTGLFLQPELVYSRNSTKGEHFVRSIATRASSDNTAKIRVQTVDVPILLSLKVSIARIQAGPVFNLMSDFKNESGNLELQPLRPSVGYALGASVDLLGLTIDGRYHGDFKKMDFKGQDWKSQFSSWSLGIGMMF